MKREHRIRSPLTAISAIYYLTISSNNLLCHGFSPLLPSSKSFITKLRQLHDTTESTKITSTSTSLRTSTQINLRPPPGSGYFEEEEEQSFFPDTYEPMMEYPGTMRPGRTPENQPYSSLPIQESDPEPVPWPHFQEIEWHHNWGSPHEHPIPMEEFIDMQGRWATAEMEAEMRAGARRGVRERRELEEATKAASFILDDDDEDDDEDDEEEAGTKLELGEGVDALIGAAAAVSSDASSSRSKKEAAKVDDDDEEEEEDDDDDGDSFLLDLGLDEVDDSDDIDDDDDTEDNGEEPAFATGDDSSEGILEAMQSIIDAGDDGEIDETLDDSVDGIDFNELGLNFDEDGDDEDDAGDGGGNGDFVIMDDDDMTIDNEDLTLDDMIGNEDMGADDDFDDGGFDYD
mmetsp:Transcript_26349/g.32473  ORF Transcript_26349/g.32473 Transcript_26349/m.32473 type:complete len:402 (-) Transcript_26349:39-1244(-)